MENAKDEEVKGLKLVHPSDPEKKVVVATSDAQVAAYKNHGFVEEKALQGQKDADEKASVDAANDKDKIAALEKELAEVKKELKAERSRKTKASKTTETDSVVEDPSQQGKTAPTPNVNDADNQKEAE
jgi:hypothetical protein